MNNTVKPIDYHHAIILLDELLSNDQKVEISKCSEQEVGLKMHFTLGLWIRNNWINDISSPLGCHIQKNELVMGYDSYSTAIIIIYHRHLNGKDLNIEEEIEKAYMEGGGWMNNN
ncbi:DUF6794 domain-containing protein [Fulvivirga sediminis]|uniref:DUF6794 domain-containing protein n=1 Tax=Fulvivirga sediminis TaxID=2803949 RepID=A0A937K3H3_9BACT|nr:DUF6794 domain-containing protein [Fulvivirga sediminis]MBL3658977.1 hypothetical protein [Fulvivirga sediminis]